jgi:DNA-binding CsgD family transcriptional regulator
MSQESTPKRGGRNLLAHNKLTLSFALGLLGALVLAAIAGNWDATQGTLTLGLRAFTFEWLGLAVAFCWLAALLSRKGKRLEAMQEPVPSSFQLSEEEQAIVAALAADPFSMSEKEIAEAAGLSGNRFKLHWHRVFEELGLVECEERRPGVELYVLSQSGRRLALERGLL